MDSLGLTLAFGVVVALGVNAGGQVRPLAPEKPIPCSPSLTVQRQTHSSVPAPIQLKLHHYVAPEYPQFARQARVQGEVRVSVSISKKGEVLSLRLISGHPLLAPATLKAVRQWRYEAACVDGKRAAWEQEATIRFSLKDGVTVVEGQSASAGPPKLTFSPGTMPDLSANNAGPSIMNPFLNLEKWDKKSRQWRPGSPLPYCKGFYFGADSTSKLSYGDQQAYYQQLEAELARSLRLGTPLKKIRQQLRGKGVAYDECSGTDKLRFNSKLTIHPHQQGLTFSLPAPPNGTLCIRNLVTYLVFDNRGELTKKDRAVALGICR